MSGGCVAIAGEVPVLLFLVRLPSPCSALPLCDRLGGQQRV